MLRLKLISAAFAVLALLALTAPAQAQLDILSGKSLKGGSAGPKDEQPVVTTEASFTLAGPGQPGKLSVTANMSPGWHIYSLTQKGGPNKTTIKVDAGPDFEPPARFTPAEAPHISQDIAFPGIDIETHEDAITWQSELLLRPGVDPSKLEIKGSIRVQACNATSCLPPAEYKFVARFQPTEEPTSDPPTPSPPGSEVDPPPSPASRNVDPVVEAPIAAVLAYRPDAQHITLRGQLRRLPVEKNGQKVAELILRAEPDPDWHLYAYAKRDPASANPQSDTIGKPTLIVIENTGGLSLSNPVPSEEPAAQLSKPGEAVTPPWYTKPVDWSIRIPLPVDAKSNGYTISGLIGFQVCHNDVGKCDPPGAARFSVTFPSRGEQPEPIYLQFTQAKAYREAAQIADRLASTEVQSSLGDKPADLSGLPLALGLALVGGLILNLMPCVFPVIGLKILSFVEQAGQKRHQILMLNLWYTLGILLVFWMLALAAVSLGLAWGEHFGSKAFNISVLSLVFVMALSFIGVWEIPIPGFVGGSTAGALASKEGAVGAVCKGAITTLLATPCSGPLLGPIFGWTLKLPPVAVFAVFTAIGLGMASPYLLLGAFPRLVKALPRPGVWMETFKQAMGFLMLAAVVFLFSSLHRDYFIPTLTFIFGLWAACWWIGRIPFTSSRPEKLRKWSGAIALSAAIGFFAFTMLVPGPSTIAWQPFSRASLAQLNAQGKTVLVDFTAEWCPTCKYNLHFVINTPEVGHAVNISGIVPMLADWTDTSPDVPSSVEIKEMLRALNFNSIPVLAIYPAGGGAPVVLSDVLTKQQVLDAISQASKSADSSSETSTAMVEASREEGSL